LTILGSLTIGMLVGALTLWGMSAITKRLMADRWTWLRSLIGFSFLVGWVVIIPSVASRYKQTNPVLSSGIYGIFLGIILAGLWLWAKDLLVRKSRLGQKEVELRAKEADSKTKFSILVGTLVITLPILIIFLIPIVLVFVLKSFLPIAFVTVSFVTAWLWWSITVPIWREWALKRGVDPEKLQTAAVAAQLVWPKGSIFEKTEFRFLVRNRFKK